MKKLEFIFQSVESRLSDGTIIFDDQEILIEYDKTLLEYPTRDEFGAPTGEGQRPEVYIDAAILIDSDGQLTDEDILSVLTPELKDDIISEILSELE